MKNQHGHTGCNDVVGYKERFDGKTNTHISDSKTRSASGRRFFLIVRRVTTRQALLCHGSVCSRRKLQQ